MWFSSFNINKKNNGHVRGITLQMFYRIQSKAIFTLILNNFLYFMIIAQAQFSRYRVDKIFLLL